jgi:hypothetical protein
MDTMAHHRGVDQASFAPARSRHDYGMITGPHTAIHNGRHPSPMTSEPTRPGDSRPAPRRGASGTVEAVVNERRSFNSQQLLFKELFVGTLIYAVVLGFFDDHTSIVEAQSYTHVFLAAIVLEVLTCAALAVKDAIIGRLRHRDASGTIALMVFGVWFVMFTSKFVFIWAIDLVFGDAVDINGFFGIFVVALVVTVVHRLADWVFVRLGRPPTSDRTVVEGS